MSVSYQSDCISICICTYHRPQMLARALDHVFTQITQPFVSFEIVVVDNDKNRSAEETVRHFQQFSPYEIIYDCEPEQNIALTRNRAICNARGNFIAFIDDDEYPTDHWLLAMYSCLIKYKADGVLGPVLPDFPNGAPTWLEKGGFCERRRKHTGELISNRDKRTGNILLRRSIFVDKETWFDPARGLTGGEDGEFLGRQMNKGHRFIWCDEALVFETITKERWHAAFYLKKEFRIGTLAGEKLRRARALRTAIKTSIILICCFLVLPLSLIMQKHIWMKVLTKLSYNAGRLLSFFGFSLLRYRN